MTKQDALTILCSRNLIQNRVIAEFDANEMKYDAEFQKQTVEYKNMPKTQNRTSLIKIINVERKYMLNKTTHNIYVLW